MTFICIGINEASVLRLYLDQGRQCWVFSLLLLMCVMYFNRNGAKSDLMEFRLDSVAYVY